MDEHRRALLKLVAGLAPAAIFAASLDAYAEGDGGQDALEAAGLDPYVVYRKMFLSTLPGAGYCWWYLGATTTHIDGIGDVVTGQVETVMPFLSRDEGPGRVKNIWREIGCFRDIATGELAKPWVNPVTGKPEPRAPSFEDGPATYTVAKSAGGVDIDLVQTHASVQKVIAAFSVAGDRICLTQTEDKIRGVDTAAPNPIQTVLKIYASLADVRDPARNTVAASGFYRAASTRPGGFGVTGLMQKAAWDEKLNPIGWDRMKAAYPSFFKGDRIDPSWD
jgi:hypothetical protein